MGIFNSFRFFGKSPLSKKPPTSQGLQILGSSPNSWAVPAGSWWPNQKTGWFNKQNTKSIKHVFFPTESQLQQKKTQHLCSSPRLSVISPFFSSSLLHSLPFVPYTFSKEVVWSALHSFCWNLLSGSGPHSTEGATTVNFPDGF